MILVASDSCGKVTLPQNCDFRESLQNRSGQGKVMGRVEEGHGHKRRIKVWKFALEGVGLAMGDEHV